MGRAKKHEWRAELPIVLAGLVLAVSLLSVFLALGAVGALEQKTSVPTPAPLARVTITQLKAAACGDCSNPQAVVTSLLPLVNASSQSVDAGSAEGRALVEKYGVTRVPTVIVEGDVDDARLASFFAGGWESRSGARVLTAVEPVFLNPVTKEVTGRVRALRVVDDTCEKCPDLAPLVDELRAAGVSIVSDEAVNASSSEGAELIGRYDPAALPFLVLSKDAGAYARLQAVWNQVGTVEPDGFFVSRVAIPPFRNLTTGDVEGLVSLTEIGDASCAACYNVSIHEDVLASLGVVVANVSVLDVKSPAGRALVDKYRILQVPTVVISADAALYPSFAQVWTNVGTKEIDGAYVFREMRALGNVTFVNVTGASG